jgi:5-methylcytosine-specific restriction enzyme A
MKGPAHALYKTSRWCHPRRGLRVQALVRDAYRCQSCGRTEHSSRLHAHHVVPHKGDPALFFDLSNITTLCEDCHNIEARQVETIGYSLALGSDGLPLDPMHPFNR